MMTTRSFDDQLDSAVSPYVEKRFHHIFNRDIINLVDDRSMFDELRLVHSTEWRDYCSLPFGGYYGPDFVLLGRLNGIWMIV